MIETSLRGYKEITLNLVFLERNYKACHYFSFDLASKNTKAKLNFLVSEVSYLLGAIEKL